jgi:hypothetical protein
MGFRFVICGSFDPPGNPQSVHSQADLAAVEIAPRRYLNDSISVLISVLKSPSLCRRSSTFRIE